MSDRTEANLEYRAEFDFTQARGQILTVQGALRRLEEIGLAAFVSIEDRATQAATSIAAKFAAAAKSSGVGQITNEVDAAVAAVERLKTAMGGIPTVGAPPGDVPGDSVPDVGGDIGGDIAGQAAAAGEAARSAAAGFSSISASLGLSGDEAERAEAIYARLLAQELKLISSGDDLTRSYVARLSAQRPEADLLEDASRLSSRLSEDQIREAEARAKLGTAIEYSAGIREKDEAIRQNALEVIGESIRALEEEDDTRRRVAAEAKTAAIDQVAALKQVGSATRESLGEQIDAQLSAAEAATAAEQEATRRRIEASRTRIAAERDASIAIANDKQEEADAYQETARRAAEAESRATADIKTAVDERSRAYQQAESIARDAEAQSASTVQTSAQKRIEAEKAAVRELAVGRKEAAEVQKATAREAAAAEQQATATQTAAIRARQSIQSQAAQAEVASARLSTAATKDAAQQKVIAERQVAAEAAKTARAREAAARLFQQTVKQTFPQEAQQLNDLVTKYGSFTFALRRNGEAMNDLEKEIQDIIKANPQLAREVDLLNQKVGNFNVNANRTTFRGGSGNLVLSPDDIRKAGFALERFGITGVAAFGEIFAAIGPAGLAIGAVIVGVVTLTKALSTLARAGVQAFQELISKSIEAGRQTEIAQAQFVSFFKGLDVPDPFAASEATLNRLSELSVKYGQDFIKLGRALLPNVSDLDQLEQAVKLAAALAALDPTAGIAGAQQALRAGLGGDLTPLFKTFEIPQSVTDRIRELQKEFGNTQGLIIGLGDYFNATGQDIDSLADTANVAIGKVGVLRQQFERTTGAPIIEQIKKSLDELFTLLDGKEADIFTIADAIGRSVASILDLITGFTVDFLEGVDTQEMKEFVFDVREAVDALLTLFNTIVRGGDDSASLFTFILDKITLVLEITEAWAAGVATVLAVLQTVSDTMLILISQAILFTAGLQGSATAMAAATRIDTGAEIAAAWERNISAVQGFVTRSQEARDANDEFSDSLDDSTAAGEEAADAALQLADARRQLTEVTTALAESQEKVSEARAEYEKDKGRGERDLEIEQTRALLKLEEELAEARVKAAYENAKKIRDIWTDHNEKLEDAALDLKRDEEKIAREEADAIAKIAQDAADERLKIEQEYLRKIQDLRRKFAFDSQEAIRANDAISYLRLQRKLGFDLEQAKIDRDRKLEDVDSKEDDATNKEKERRDRAREEARIANEQKLEDLRIALEREIKARAVAYRDELIELSLAEKDKRDELQRSFDEQKEDFDRQWDDKLDDLEANLAEEFALIVENEKKKLQLQQQAWEAEKRLLTQQAQERQAIINQQGGTVRPRYGDGGFVPDTDQGEGAGGNFGQGQGSPPKRPEDYTQAEIEVLRQKARDLARRMGNDELMRLIATMTVRQLITLLRTSGIPLRDSGGHVQAGQPVQVGKPELLIPNTSGFIYPLDVLRPMFTPPAPNVTTNNNRSTKIDLSMLDPSMVDLQRKETMKSWLREVLADVLQ